MLRVIGRRVIINMLSIAENLHAILERRRVVEMQRLVFIDFNVMTKAHQQASEERRLGLVLKPSQRSDVDAGIAPAMDQIAKLALRNTNAHGHGNMRAQEPSHGHSAFRLPTRGCENGG